MFLLIVCCGAEGLPGAVSAQAQGAANEPTWAVELLPGSRCATDPTFLQGLQEPIPAGQRAPLDQAELRAQVRVDKTPTATITVLDQLTRRQAGQRTLVLSGGSCIAAADALALVISVMVESGRALFPVQEPTPEPVPEPKKEEALPRPPSEDAADQEPRRPARTRRPERHAWLGPRPGHDLLLAVGASYGLLPDFSIGGSLGWGIRSARIWPVWIAGTGWLNEPTSDLRARVGAAYGTLGTCPLSVERGRWRAQLCPTVSVGGLWAEGRRVAGRRRSRNALGMVGADGGAHLKLIGPLELVVRARLDVPLVRLSFVYYRQDGSVPELHHTKPVVASLFGGIGLRFR